NTIIFIFFFSSRRRHTSFSRDWSSDVCSSDLGGVDDAELAQRPVEECGIAFQVTEHRYPAGHRRHGGRYAGVIQHEGMPPARAVDLQLVAAPARLSDIVLAEPLGRPRAVAAAPDDRPVEQARQNHLPSGGGIQRERDIPDAKRDPEPGWRAADRGLDRGARQPDQQRDGAHRREQGNQQQRAFAYPWHETALLANIPRDRPADRGDVSGSIPGFATWSSSGLVGSSGIPPDRSDAAEQRDDVVGDVAAVAGIAAAGAVADAEGTLAVRRARRGVGGGGTVGGRARAEGRGGRVGGGEAVGVHGVF